MPLSPPPIDAAGQVTPHDHEQLEAADVVIRRISPQWVVTEHDGRKRLSSQAFEASSDGTGVSLDIEKLIVEQGQQPAQYVTSPKHPAAISWSVGALRQQAECFVGYDPLPDNPAHGAAWPKSKLKSNRSKKIIASAAWLVPMPGVDLG
jgi:hypothetical protein